jgi:hypothetical protein
MEHYVNQLLCSHCQSKNIKIVKSVTLSGDVVEDTNCMPGTVYKAAELVKWKYDVSCHCEDCNSDFTVIAYDKKWESC